jgi:transposase
MMVSDRKTRIWLARHRVDFRRHHDGLLAEAYRMALDPFAGDIVIFIGRNRRALKILYADPTGLCMKWKKFTMEAMKTRLGFLLEPACESITAAELAMLMEGSSYTIEKKVAGYIRPIDRTGGAVQNFQAT